MFLKIFFHQVEASVSNNDTLCVCVFACLYVFPVPLQIFVGKKMGNQDRENDE